jgi:exopolyphosphatase/guanosine-5'-triphosphate,3'-diphosphate pyrophosphatase
VSTPATTLAVVDLGSNSFRLEIGRVEGDQIYRLDTWRETLRFGAGLDAQGRIKSSAMKAALECLGRFRERLAGLHPSAVRAVATNTFRVAKNAREFLPRAERALGFPIDVIGGHEEARLIYLGVAHELPRSLEPRLVVDIGGGSTEFIVGTDRVEGVMSVDIGCVRLTEKFLHHDPPQPEELSACISLTDAYLDDVVREIPAAAEARTLVGLAGTVTTVAAVEIGLETYDRDRIHHFHLTHDAAEDVFRTLATESRADRIHNPGLEEARADVIVAGCCVLVAVFRHFGFDEMIVSEADILDGLALSLLD